MRSDRYWRLGELDDELRCPACQQTFPLPAVEDGREEAAAYRLDGLVARATDQDLLPVLLTLRFLLRSPGTSAYAQWWPGLDLHEGDAEKPEREVDLLFADLGRLWIAEVKGRAEALSGEEARAMLVLARCLGGQAVFAALTGTWRDEVTDVLEQHAPILLTVSYSSNPDGRGQRRVPAGRTCEVAGWS